MTPATTSMNLEDILLNEINQSQKEKYCLFHFQEVPKAVKFIDTENRMLVARAWVRGDGEFSGCGVSVLKMKRVLELRGIPM